MSSQSNKSSLRQFLPEHILTSLKAALPVVISRRSQGWLRIDQWAIEPQAGVKIHCTFGHFIEFFSLNLYEKNGYFVRIHWQGLYKAALLTVVFVPFGLETSDRTSDRSKPAKCLSPCRGRNNFFSFLFLVWPYNKQLINRARPVCMGESWPRSLVQTSLRSVCTGDLGQDSPIQTSRSVNKN